MEDRMQATQDTSNQGGNVIQFPRSGGSTTPPRPLPRLARAFPTPGGGPTSGCMFEHVLTRRFDSEAA